MSPTNPRGQFPAEDEPFELLDFLGSGAFAQTWRARVVDPELAEEYGVSEVALKIPLNRQKQRSLRDEIELNAGLYARLSRIASPNLVRYLGFEAFQAKIVMAMEFVPGQTLRRRVGKIPGPTRRNKPMGVDEAVRMTVGILTGLDLIHREHILHRDIKPENILLDGDTPKIADLGISRMLASDELASTTAGTIYYMSPEILGEGASYPSDIWSVGVTLYEMLTGGLPFGDGTTPVGTLFDLIRSGAPTPPHDLCSDVPAQLDRIVLRALEKDPRERFQAAAAMLQALQELERPADDLVDEQIAQVRAMIESGGAPQAILDRLREVIEEFPESPKGYQLLGQFHNRCNSYADAVKAFQAGIKRNPKDAMLHWDLALAYQKQPGNAAKARDALHRAIELGLDESLQRHAVRLLRVLEAE
jgi:serine/threonine protein kinase